MLKRGGGGVKVKNWHYLMVKPKVSDATSEGNNAVSTLIPDISLIFIDKYCGTYLFLILETECRIMF